MIKNLRHTDNPLHHKRFESLQIKTFAFDTLSKTPYGEHVGQTRWARLCGQKDFMSF